VPPDDRRALTELVHIDLERRLRAGEGVRVESYLQRYPALAAEAAGVLAVLGAEYEQRRREPGLSPAEYTPRSPKRWNSAHVQRSGRGPAGAGGEGGSESVVTAISPMLTCPSAFSSLSGCLPR
jgi:hypothetical protein